MRLALYRRYAYWLSAIAILCGVWWLARLMSEAKVASEHLGIAPLEERVNSFPPKPAVDVPRVIHFKFTEEAAGRMRPSKIGETWALPEELQGDDGKL